MRESWLLYLNCILTAVWLSGCFVFFSLAAVGELNMWPVI